MWDMICLGWFDSAEERGAVSERRRVKMHYLIYPLAIVAMIGLALGAMAAV